MMEFDIFERSASVRSLSEVSECSHTGDTTPNTSQPLCSISQSTSLLANDDALLSSTATSTTTTTAKKKPRAMNFRSKNFADPTIYDIPVDHPNDNGRGKATAREYRRTRQENRILLNSLTRVLFTAVLCTLCAVVLIHFKSKGLLSPKDVQWFTTWMTALPLLVGLNYRSSLHSYAKILRWKVLATWDWPLRQFDLILEAAETQALLKLMWYARREKYTLVPNTIQLAATCWLLVNVAGALAISLLGLTYSLDVSSSVAFRKGPTSALSLLSPWLHANAWYYGVYSSPSLTTAAGASAERRRYAGLSNPFVAEVFSHCEGCQVWRYNFILRHPSSGDFGIGQGSGSAIAYCEAYPVVARDNLTVTYRNDSDIANTTRRLGFEWMGDPYNSTIYINNRAASWVVDPLSLPPPSCVNTTVCANIIILKGKDFEWDQEVLYICTNGLYEGTTDSPLLAAAITRPMAMIRYPNDTTEGFQYKGVDAWALPSKSAKLPMSYLAKFAASTLAQFSMTALAAADQGAEYLPPTLLPISELRYLRNDPEAFEQPYRPSELLIRWSYAIAILCVVPVLQMSVLLAIVLSAKSIIVKDESHLCTTRLLAPVVEQLGEVGCLLTVDDVVENKGGDAMRLRYGWEQVDGAMRVRIFETEKGAKVALRGTGSRVKKEKRRFPEGKYD
jgi:hypothetical protein